MPGIPLNQGERVRLLVWIAILAVGAALRLWQLPDQLLLDDEWHALRKLTRAGFAEILTSFGSADHSIPLTAYYNAISRWGGDVTEWRMRLPLLVAGMIMIVAIPLLARRVTTANERLLTGALLAISPLMIYFSRQARPYTLSVLLTCIAIAAFWRWWHHREHTWAMIYIGCTALAAWLLPITLVFTLAPFVYFGAIAIWRSVRERNWSSVYPVIVLGFATLIPLLILLAPPVVTDFESLAGKAGSDQVTPRSALVAIELFMGASNPAITLIWCSLGAYGAYLLFCRQRHLATYLAVVAAIGITLIVSTNAASISHGLVLARYLLPLQPLLLVLVAIGAVGLLRLLPAAAAWPSAALALVALYWLGPVPAQYHQPINQLTGHAAYHFDYDFGRSAYRVMLPRGPVAPFHQRLAEIAPGSVTLIVMPWHIESHWNRMHYEQESHRQRLLIGFASGYCDSRIWGEYAPDARGVALRHVARIEEVVAQPAQSEADYLVFHKPAWEPPDPELDEWLGNRERLRPLRNLDSCLQQLHDDLGPPVYEDRAMVVFALEGDPADAASISP